MKWDDELTASDVRRLMLAIGPELNKVANQALQARYGTSPLMEWSFEKVWQRLGAVDSGVSIRLDVVAAVGQLRKLKASLARSEFLHYSAWQQGMVDADIVGMWLGRVERNEE